MPATLPFNHMLYQLVRNHHLTFRQMWRDLIMQIYGHEALIKNKNTAEISHCTVFDVDVYRLNTIKRKKHLALRNSYN